MIYMNKEGEGDHDNFHIRPLCGDNGVIRGWDKAGWDRPGTV